MAKKIEVSFFKKDTSSTEYINIKGNTKSVTITQTVEEKKGGCQQSINLSYKLLQKFMKELKGK